MMKIGVKGSRIQGAKGPRETLKPSNPKPSNPLSLFTIHYSLLYGGSLGC